MDKDSYYFHNIKATALFSFSLKTGFDLLDIGGEGFSFYHNSKTNRVWRTSSYLPISVTRNFKPWGYFDTQRQKLHIITRGDFENQLNSFVALLKKHIPDTVIKTINFKYVEVCTRYEDKYFDVVSRFIKKAEGRFFTNTKTDSFDKRIKGQTWLTLGRELSIKQTKLNIKTYRFVEEIKNRKRTISESILPKIEVQIYKPNNLEEAKQIAVPIIKAFQKTIGFDTKSMDPEPDYVRIQGTLSLSHNQKLVDLFNKNSSANTLRFPKTIIQDDLTYQIACFLTSVAKTRKEIVAKHNINKSKLNRVLSTLSPYLEKRGNNAIGIYYQIDPDLIKQHLDNNKDKGNVLTKHRVNSDTSNKSKGNDSESSVSIIAEEQTHSTKPSQTTILHDKKIPNELVNSSLSNGLNINNSTNQKLNIQVLKGSGQKPKFKKVRITAFPQTVGSQHLSIKRKSD